MAVILQARIPGPDLAQRILFASSNPAEYPGAHGQIESAAKIFPGGSFRSDLAVQRRLEFLDSRTSRLKPQELLRQENSFAPLTHEQKINLEAAGSDKALFLLTGQQPGLFGGPILWLYKALTCAALAKEWSGRLSRPVIPIFWVAGDDADLAECNHLEILDAPVAQVQGPWSLTFPNAASSIPMGERQVEPNGVATLLARLSSIWNPETIELLRCCYPDPSTLTSGFLRLAQSQLGKEGILFVDGYSKNLRALAQPVLKQSARHWESFHAALSKGTKAAEAAGIKIQVPLRAGLVHAFSLQAGQRHRLYAEKTTEGADRIYNPEHPSKDLLPNLADLNLTHDVFTRPLVADSLFPVLGHVLGPAELRYFSQLTGVFLETTGGMPLLHPRMSVTVAPLQAKEEFKAEGMELSDVVGFGPAGLRSHLEQKVWQDHPAFSELSPSPVADWIAGLGQIHERHFPDPGPLNRLEKSLRAAWKRYLRSLERMAFGTKAHNSEKLFRHLQWLGGGLGQDRHLNFPSLYHALGKTGFTALRAAMEPTQPDLQLFLYSNEGT